MAEVEEKEKKMELIRELEKRVFDLMESKARAMAAGDDETSRSLTTTIMMLEAQIARLKARA
ncbi:hypothetical protein [Candidatus Methanodesulfokora washburnensis]|uniref:Uncharacterized protein n=1 Tax=Candidatus Methanodesulfokora washburnensis TaxID=2478471 RepID=A0A3R9QK27_9CREN|nr:hypothetical protein [Candidatus Methanodesulfokores washburnensis]RSN78426.1 hypothetical protein D6D85_00965 [Candidatus Methanodesulfokores washburnensis]